MSGEGYKAANGKFVKHKKKSYITTLIIGGEILKERNDKRRGIVKEGE